MKNPGKNISEFSHFKKIKTYKKKGSPHTLEFLTIDPEGWFIDVVRYKTSSGEVVADHLIIEKDIPTWESFHMSLGWSEV